MNPRDGYPPYALSRGASSANLSKSPDEVWYYYEKMRSETAVLKRYGGEGGIRTHGSCESLVFKTSSLNHSDTSPYLRATSDIIPPKSDLSTLFSKKINSKKTGENTGLSAL